MPVIPFDECTCHVLQSMEGGLEQEQLQQEAELNQRVNEEEVRSTLF